MNPAQKTAPSSRTSAGKRPAPKEPAALKRLNRSLDTAQDALQALRKNVSKDVSVGTRALYKDLETFVTDARRDGRKLGKALDRDVRRAQKKLTGASGRGRTSSRAKASSASKRSTARS